MKAIVDEKRRVTLGKGVRAGDVYEVDTSDTRRIVLTRFEAPKARSRLVRCKGYLMLETDRQVTIEAMFKAIQEQGL